MFRITIIVYIIPMIHIYISIQLFKVDKFERTDFNITQSKEILRMSSIGVSSH
jgi:hypothetical protein